MRAITFRFLFLVLGCTAVLVTFGRAAAVGEGEHSPAPPPIHREVPNDPWMPNPINVRRKPARVVRGIYESIQVNVDEFGMNIVGDAANEPSIAVDPNDDNKMAIGWRQFDSVNSDFRQSGYGYTTDGGASWTFPGSLKPGVFGSDPVLASDREGVFYYVALDFSELRLFRSFNGGRTWHDPIQIASGFHDKEWMVIDRTGGIGDGNIYLAWSGFQPFTRSTDGGLTFHQPIIAPISDPFLGTMHVDESGRLYLMGWNFSLVRSSDAKDPAATPTFEVIGGVELGGVIASFRGPNPSGLLGQVWISGDNGVGANAGNLYALASVDPPGVDPLDVMFTRSTDGGLTWSNPVRINDDRTRNGAWQWFGTMSVSPNGRIDVVWNDTRNDFGGTISELYYSFSDDGGLSWAENIPLSPPFDPHLGYPRQDKLGDYYHMVSDRFGANLAYAATFNGEQDVFFLRIPAECRPDTAEGLEARRELNGDGCAIDPILDECEADCNDNAQRDVCDVLLGSSTDCNENMIPDECEEDCNGNGQGDACDVLLGDSTDCNENSIPDECEVDCNGNGHGDVCDIRFGDSTDCNENMIPDECEEDCNGNGQVDVCDVLFGVSIDCNENAIPDECEEDCNGNGRWDGCDVALGDSSDCNGNSIPDECEEDCNGNGQLDSCDVLFGESTDCNENMIPDECEEDCNGNGQVDVCDVLFGVSTDCDENSIPDECEDDCNGNGRGDACDVLENDSDDLNGDLVPDECQAVLFVDVHALGIESGLNWRDAYHDLTDALDLASLVPGVVQEIWVAAGVYVPSGDANLATFALADGVAVLGGFAGYETLASQRDWSTNRTMLSGDLNGDDGQDSASRIDNSLHVLAANGVGAGTILDGFSISGGNADGDLFGNNGGAITISNSVLVVRNCALLSNSAASNGGAVRVENLSSVLFSNCVFVDNYALSGGVMSVSANSDVVLENCTLTGNVAEAFSGGLIVFSTARVELVNSVVWGNDDFTGTGFDAQILLSGGEVSLRYSCVQGLPIGPDADGNIGVDPMFVDVDGPDDILGTLDDNVRLQSGSPCINTGDPSVMLVAAALDLDHHPRVLCGRVDMGAYESGIGDFDCNGVLNLADFAGWDACMIGPDVMSDVLACAAFDFNGDGHVDLRDMGSFLGAVQQSP